MPKLFGTSGIRGPAEALFTNTFCTQIGATFATWLKSKSDKTQIAVAYDPRGSSPRIKEHLIQGLSSVGFEILDEGVVPTPALAYFTKINHNLAGAVMVTGSHITSELNGLKFLLNGDEITKDNETEIENLFSSLTVSTNNQLPITNNSSLAKDGYLDMLLNLAFTPYPNWKIVVDTANGTQSVIIRELFTALGLELVCTGDCDIQSPYFVPRDTEVQSSVADLQHQVLSEGAGLGIAFDADGDRVVFVDSLGRFIPGDYSCSLIARDSGTKTIVTTVGTGSVVDTLGIPVVRTQVGSPYVIAKMHETGASFGFEPNGGSISGELFYGRDGGSTVIKLLNILKNSNRTLADLVNSLPHFSLYKDKIDCPIAKYTSIYSAVKEKYSTSQIDETDGVKVILNSTDWLLFRGSGNAPEFRVFAQSTTDEKARDLVLKSLAFIKSTIHNPTNNQQLITNNPIDSLHVLESIKSFPTQIEQVLSDQGSFRIPAQCDLVDNIVVVGMGGSALGGRIISALEHDIAKVPVIVSTDYKLPNFVGKKTLVMACSYSGDTEETLIATQEALTKNANVFVITTGGKLAELADSLHLSSYIINPIHNPSGQPRLGLGYSIMPLICVLQRCGHITTLPDLGKLPEFLRSNQNESVFQQLATKLHGKIPVLVSSEHLVGVSHAIKNMFNENSKTFAVSFDLPELNHHLLEGLQFPHTNPNNLAVVFINSPYYHPKLSASISATKQVFQKNKIPVFELDFKTPSPIFESLLYLQSGALTSYYLSQTYGVDPGPIPYVHWYKDQLK